MVADSSLVLIPGPWEHHDVPTNGAQLHAAVAGPEDPARPLVVLLAGFPQFWFAWRHQLEALAAAGHRVAAVDLRGSGGSDKPPRGHEPYVKARDVVGVVRHLGHDRAVVVGHGLAAATAWTVPTIAPDLVAGLVTLAGPHPVTLHGARHGMTAKAIRQLAYAQAPWFPERALVTGDLVRRVLAGWSGRVGRSRVLANAELYTGVMQLPFAAHCAMEHVRWLVRSAPRPNGRRWLGSLREGTHAPVLSVQGTTDPLLTPEAYAADGQFARGGLERVRVPGAGHFLPEEAPERVSELLASFVAALADAR